MSSKDAHESTADPLLCLLPDLFGDALHHTTTSANCFALSLVSLSFVAFIARDPRFLKHHVDPSCRFVQHAPNLDVTQGRLRYFCLCLCIILDRIDNLHRLVWRIWNLLCQAGSKKCFPASCLQYLLISGRPSMRRSICSQRVASWLVAVGGFLSNKTSPAQVTTLSSALAGMLSYNKKRHCYSDEIQNLRFEHVVD